MKNSDKDKARGGGTERQEWEEGGKKPSEHEHDNNYNGKQKQSKFEKT